MLKMAHLLDNNQKTNSQGDYVDLPAETWEKEWLDTYEAGDKVFKTG